MRNAEFGMKKEHYDRYRPANRSDSISPAPRDAHPASRIPQPDTGIQPSGKSDEQVGIWQKKQFGDLRPIGQFRNTYIVCESEDSLILIDQHAAHERILFEKLWDQSRKASRAGQQLLVPETVDLGFREADALAKVIEQLSSFGLVIEPFGGNTFIIKSVPAFLSGREAKPLIVEIAESLVTVGHSSGLQQALEHCCHIIACHGAIRANQPLTDQQISGLLKQLDACENPSHCPHGRPTWIKWDQNALEKSFKRIL
jgi:DNA mismatch repair protein MutL